MEQEKIARWFYQHYCAAVGGKAWNGDPLPVAAEFFADQKKELQADAWRQVAALALVLVNSPASPIPEPGDSSE